MTVVNIKSKISKSEISVMQREIFAGRINVIDTEDKVLTAVNELRKEKIVGFDTETRPSFKKGVVNRISLLQLSTEDVSFLFRLNRIGIPEQIVDFLGDQSIVKIGLSVRDDFCALNRTQQVSPESFIELQDYAASFGIEEKSLQKIYALLFGKKISKNQQLSNWEIETLTYNQCQYASIDAWACLKIYSYLEQLKKTGKYKVVKIYAEEGLVKEG